MFSANSLSSSGIAANNADSSLILFILLRLFLWFRVSGGFAVRATDAGDPGTAANPGLARGP